MGTWARARAGTRSVAARSFVMAFLRRKVTAARHR
jgi:hypothetical protein